MALTEYLAGMSLPEPQFRRGAGQPGQLPYGAATELNAQAAAGRQLAAQGRPSQGGSPSASGQGPAPQAPQELPPERGTLSNADFSWLLQGQGGGGGAAVPPTRVGQDVEAWRPLLAQAASLPGAAPALKALNAQLLVALGPL